MALIKGLALSVTLPSSGTEYLTIDSSGNLGTATAPGGGTFDYAEVANKSAVLATAHANGKMRKALTNNVVYLSYGSVWGIWSMASVGTLTDRNALTEMEVGQSFTTTGVNPVTYVWSGSAWESEGP